MTDAPRTQRRKVLCKYPGCNNGYCVNLSEGSVNKHIFRFPKDPQQRQLWRTACKVNDSQNVDHWIICEDHFEATAFMNERRNSLKFNATPISSNGIPEASGIVDGDELMSSVDVNEPTSTVQHDKSLPSTSTSVCPCEDICLVAHPLTSGSEITSNESFSGPIQDHSYSKADDESEVTVKAGKFDFLGGNKGREGILGRIGLSKKELTPRKNEMYKVHRQVTSRLSKLKKELENSKDELKTLQNLYKAGKFEFIEENLNLVTKEFINSQLQNATCHPNARRWTEQTKAFSLSVYKQSPRLYRYLQAHFQLPSSRTLKTILSKIPFSTGVNPPILNHLKSQIGLMKQSDRYCSLLFDEVSLSSGFHYEKAKEYICGFEDLGSLGRANRAANHALVFMVRGIRRQWKQVIAYYFTTNSISANNLKNLVKEIISQLQGIGLNVVATVCDQGPTNCSAIKSLCSENHPRQSPYYFFVNDLPIVTIFDVPHLLKNTRNCLLRSKIQFGPHKCAKFEHIKSVFDFDQTKSFKALPKLKKEHFNFKDSYVKMKVKVAAAQLSSSVASCIETFVTFVNRLPAEAIFTAEFCQLIDNLFDSLNSSTSFPSGSKQFRRALSDDAPHLEFWSKLITDMNHWKIIDLNNGTDVTRRYSFVTGWQTLMDCSASEPDNLHAEDSQGLAYVAGWVLRNINVSGCDTCRNELHSDHVSHHHVLTSLRERSDQPRLNYASENLMLFLQNLHDCLNNFLDNEGYKFRENLESSFKNLFLQQVNIGGMQCTDHNCYTLVLEKCVPFLIFKYCRDRNQDPSLASKGPSHKRQKW